MVQEYIDVGPPSEAKCHPRQFKQHKRLNDGLLLILSDYQLNLELFF